MLEIRTFRSAKKGLRIDLFRRYTHKDKSGKSKLAYKQIGSFLLSQGYSSELLAMLDLIEVLQLENWLAESRFGEQFKVEADDLTKFPIRMPQAFYEALCRLYLEAKRVDLDFVPSHIMLEALMKTAKLAQQKIDKINGFSSEILESIGIQSTKLHHGEEEQLSVIQEQESRSLFRALLELQQPIGKTCSELETAAFALGKTKRIPPPQLYEWAGDLPNRNPHKPIKKWAYAIAIDVLHQHGINPITIISPEKVVEYWAIQRQNKYTLKEAQETFIKTFSVSKDLSSNVRKAIMKVYKRGFVT